MRDRFPPEVLERLEFYVYRLVDPTNGETFYVGKGKGNRVFDHARGTLKLSARKETLDPKMSRIEKIRSCGLEVGHVIHRHGISDEEAALQVEAALIDAYPGLTNKADGHSNDFGVAHVEEIISLYCAEPLVPRHPILLISIGKTFYEEGKDLYDAVRYAWVVSLEKANRATYVLAHVQGLVKGAFQPTKWMKATKENFPGFESGIPGRFGFEGREADEAVRKLYVGKRIPDRYRARGAANPIRYILEPENIGGLGE